MIQRGGKLVMLHVKDCEAETLQPIILQYVNAEATLISDLYNAYNSTHEHCTHFAVKDHNKGFKSDYNPEIHTNNIEGSWTILKRAVSVMYNHVSRKHIQLYLDEVVFRFNMSKFSPSDRFHYLQMHSNVRTRYKELIAA